VGDGSARAAAAPGLQNKSAKAGGGNWLSVEAEVEKRAEKGIVAAIWRKGRRQVGYWTPQGGCGGGTKGTRGAEENK
jgi:hypothetical protein